MKLTIVSVQGVQFTGDVEKFSIATSSGVITVLPHHIPLISELVGGTVHITENKEEKAIEIKGGVLEIRKDNSAVVLAS